MECEAGGKPQARKCPGHSATASSSLPSPANAEKWLLVAGFTCISARGEFCNRCGHLLILFHVFPAAPICMFSNRWILAQVEILHEENFVAMNFSSSLAILWLAATAVIAQNASFVAQEIAQISPCGVSQVLRLKGSRLLIICIDRMLGIDDTYGWVLVRKHHLSMC